MRVAIEVYMALGLGITLGATVPGSVAAQVPTVESKPRVAAPAGGAVIQTAAPADAATPAAQPPGQPTAAPTAAAPSEPAPVSAAPAPSGVTQLPAPAPPPATSSSSAAVTGRDRTYTAANFSLSLDGANVGALAAVEGGAVAAEVVVENAGPDNIRKKHVAGVKYEELSVDVGLDAKPVIEWITSTWQGKQPRKSGSVQVADFNYNVRGERQFSNALITGTTIPTLDGTSKDAGYLTVTIAPESVREMAGSGQVAKSPSKQQKKWLTSNFSLELGDLPGKRVARIESFTVGQRVTENQVGEFRDLEKQPGTLVFPDLKVSLSQADAEPWAKWHEEFVVKGNNGDAQEKNGAIVFLSPNMKDEVGRINLFNCGIFRFGAARLEANASRVPMVIADLYCERMELVAK